MKRSRYSAVLVATLLLLILAGAWLWQFQVNARPASEANQTLKLPQRKKQAVVVPRDFEWDSLSANDLNLLSGHFGASKSPNSFDLSFIPSGETIIADVYEAMPGEFICTKLTPTVKRLDDGMEVAVVKVDCLSITLSGEVNTRFTRFKNTHELKPGNSKSIVEVTNDGQYEMDFGVIRKGGNAPLEVHVHSRFKERSAQSKTPKLPE